MVRMSAISLTKPATLSLTKNILILFISYVSNINAEIIPSFKIKTYTFGALFTFNDDRSIKEDTWQNACSARGLDIVLIPGAQGRTIFWKLDANYLKAKGALQCR